MTLERKKTDEVFRFVNVRPVQKAPSGNIERKFTSYDRNEKSPLHKTVEQLQGDDAREEAIELARNHLTNSVNLDKEFQLVAVAQQASSQDTAKKAKQVVATRLGKDVSAYLASSEAKQLRDRLWDSLYAHTLAPEERPEDRDTVYGGVRAFHFLRLLAPQADTDVPLRWEKLQSVTPIIPKGVLPKAPPMAENGNGEDGVVKELESVRTRLVSLENAITDLHNTNRTYRLQQSQTVPEKLSVESPNGALRVPLQVGRLTKPVVDFKPPAQDIPLPTVAAEPDVDDRALAEATETDIDHRVVVVPPKTPWLFDEFGENNLGQTTKGLLATRKSGLENLEVAEAVTALQEEMFETASSFLKQLPREALKDVRHLDSFKEVLEKVPVPFYDVAPAPLPATLPAPGSAASRGIRPLGIGDMQVVKQELLRYATGEVAHIENVLKSEFKTRKHTRTRETEEIIVIETETVEESEKDLQSTERFELSTETQKTIESEMSLEAGVSVTASYGVVSLTAHADFALNQSTSEANKQASTFAKEVTERSVSKIMQRAREERTRRTLERFEEVNEHGFDNKTGNDHVIGVYRWVDKYYKARVVNYGRRLMMEFIVPEPAAFYLYLQANKRPALEGVTLQRPEEPKVSGRPLRPVDLNKWNYTDYVAKYNVQDVDPYPAEVLQVSSAVAAAVPNPDNNSALAQTGEKLIVPAGYKCYDVYGEMGYQGKKDTSFFLECFIAGQRWGSVTARDVENIIPISVKGWLTAFHVNVTAICELKPEAKAAWQLKTYKAIMNAYESALADYNEQVAAAQIQAGVRIEGRNPEFNRRIERDELKKGALRLLTNNFAMTRVSGEWRSSEAFNAMLANGQYGYPDFDIDETSVEGKMIQFIEQAFEWENMTYFLYPYIWGRKDNWDDVFPLNDTDPQFRDFLRAGAARVIVPVHSAYNETVLHYLNTNEIWNGGDPPTLEDPLYISIVDELKSATGTDVDADLETCSVDSGYPCLVDEWEVKLPTTLVYLQKGAELPNFVDNSPGEDD
jgi:hypothetical protein